MHVCFSIVIFIFHHGNLANALLLQNCEPRNQNQCNNLYVPTEQDVETARVFIQKRFLEKAAIKPQQPPCKKLFVRRNFKCLSHNEKMRVVRVVQQLYANGFMEEIMDIHVKCWGPWHSTSEGMVAHRMISLKVEQAMRRVDPDITLPYWVITEDCVRPEKSLIWKYFGTTGTKATNWCVTDSPFVQQTRKRCVQRQWTNGKIPSYACVENDNIGLRLGLPFVLVLAFASGYHFHPHIAIGGWHSHYATDNATYDFIFHPHHNYYTECWLTRYQLSLDRYLTPLDYNTLPHLDVETHDFRFPADIRKDRFCHWKTLVLDAFHIGFGEHCSVCDQVVKDIVERVENQNVTKKNDNPLIALPFFDANFKTCNSKCHIFPNPPTFEQTPAGRRQARELDSYGPHLTVAYRLTDFLLRIASALLNLFNFCTSSVPW